MDNLDSALYAAEQEAQGNNEVFEINIARKITGMKAPLQVYPTTTMGQVLDESVKLLGVNPQNGKIIFENANTHESTAKTETTIAEMGLGKGDTLYIAEDGIVAAC